MALTLPVAGVKTVDSRPATADGRHGGQGHRGPLGVL